LLILAKRVNPKFGRIRRILEAAEESFEFLSRNPQLGHSCEFDNPQAAGSPCMERYSPTTQAIPSSARIETTCEQLGIQTKLAG
jgi:hypothetical protein